MRISILAQFPDPEDMSMSKAGYRHILSLSKILSEDNEVTLHRVHRSESNVRLHNCTVTQTYSLNPLKRLIDLTRRIFEQRKMIDLLIVHNPTIFAIPVVLLKMVMPFPVVVDYTDRQTTPTYARSKLVRFISYFSENLFLLTMENWLVESPDLENNVRKVRGKRNIMSYNALVSEPPPSNGRVKSLPFEIDPNKINIAYTGALLFDHGVDILIDAVSELPLDEFHLYVTGYGPMKPALEDKIKDKNLSSSATIAFLSNEVFDNFLIKMDILVIPSRDTDIIRQIGFPSKILSYMWAGKVIVATSTACMRDLLEDGKTAILVKPGSKEALRDTLMELAASKDKRHIIGLNARKYFDDNFSPEAVKSRLNEFLLNVVKRNMD